MLVATTVFALTKSFKQNQDGTVQMKDGRDEAFDVVLDFADRNKTEALYTLIVNTSKNVVDTRQAYMAGYSEGYVTADLIAMHYDNSITILDQAKDENGNPAWNPWYITYAQKQRAWINEQIAGHPGNEWWHGVDLIHNYWLNGIVDGFNAARSDRKMTSEMMYVLNMQGDMDDLEFYAKPEEMQRRINEKKYHHCSGSVRLTSDCKDIFFSQDTWTDFYAGFLRIAKTYLFNFAFNQTQKQQVTFSSYPGYFFSIDDFYVIHNQDKLGNENNLAILETTFHTFNTDLYKQFLDPEGKAVLTWMRCQLSNLFAFTQDQWVASFNDFAPSYTYNNNYLLLDYLKFEQAIANCPKCDAEGRRAYILNNKIEVIKTLEVVPGHPKYWDATPALIQQGYYVSFNTPIDPELFVLSGYEAKNIEEGTNYWSYEHGARKCITDAKLVKVETLSDFMSFVRYNDWKNDPCQKGDSGQAISSRYDQRSAEIEPKHQANHFGATDSKVVSLQMSKEFKFMFIVGPIFGGDSDIPKWDFTKYVPVKGAKPKHPQGVHNVLPSVWSEIYGFGDYPDYTTAVVCSIVIPCVCIAIGLGVWAFIFYKKGGYNQKRAAEAEIASLIATDDLEK